MAWSGGVLTLPVLLTAVLLTGAVYTSAANTPVNQTTTSKGTDPSTEASRSGTVITTTIAGNRSEIPGSASTIHPLNTTTPSAPFNKPLSTGQIVAIVFGVLSGVGIFVILILCLRKTSGYRKAVSAPVTYRKGSNMRNDRAPLTTKEKDPSPLPGCVEDHFTLYEDDLDRRLQKRANGDAKTALRRGHGDRESLDGDGTARDGGEDDYFYDEIFGQSAFTDEQTSASIKELSSPKPDDEWPDLNFDDFEMDDPFK